MQALVKQDFMTRKNNRCLLISFLVTVLFAVSCGSEKEGRFQKINDVTWIDDSILFIERECHIDLSLDLSSNPNYIPVKHNDGVFGSAEDYIREQFKLRKLLALEASKYLPPDSDIFVFEIYNRESSKVIIHTTEGKEYKFSSEKGMLQYEGESKIEVNGQKLFSLPNGREEVCFTQFENVPLKMMFFSKLNISKGEYHTFQASVYEE